jgi:hypothetical protein
MEFDETRTFVKCRFHRLSSIVATPISVRKSWVLVTAILFGYFLLITYMNVKFSSSIDAVGDREIDELAFHLALKDSRSSLISGYWYALITTGDYAYGFSFWALNTLATAPIEVMSHLLSPDSEIQRLLVSMLIIVPRQLSLIFTIATVLIWLKILEEMYPRNIPSTKVFQTIAILLIPVVSYGATKFHPTALIGLLTSIAIWFSVSYPSTGSDYKRFIFSGIFFGAALGIKLSAIVVLPAVLLFLFFKNNRLNLWRKYIYFGTSGSVTFLLNAAPLGIFQIFQGTTPELLLTIFGQLAIQEGTIAKVWPLNLLDGIVGFFVSGITLVALTLMGAILAFSKNKFHDPDKYKNFMIGIFSLVASLAAISWQVGHGSTYVAIYLAPLAFLILSPIALLQLFRRSSILFISFIFFLLFTNFSNVWIIDKSLYDPREKGVRAINFFDFYENSQAYKVGEVTKREIRMLIVAPNVQAPVRIIADHRVPLPYTPMHEGVSIIYIFDNIEKHRTLIQSGEFDFIILDPASVFSHDLQAADKACDYKTSITSNMVNTCLVIEEFKQLDSQCGSNFCIFTRKSSD